MRHTVLVNERSSYIENGNNLVLRLDRVRKIIDDKFVAAGDILLTSLKGINGLINSLDTLSRTFDAGIAAATKADLTLAAAKLCTLPACRAQQVEHFRALSRLRTKLGRHVSSMHCNIAFVGALVRSAKATTATVPDAWFARFSDAMDDYAAGIGTELHNLEGDLTVLQRDLDSSATHSEVLDRQMAVLLPFVPDDLAAAADIVSSHYTAVAATAEQVSTIARAIQRRVVRILEALQFGDITRQRIEHILTCLVITDADAAWQPPEIRHRFKATCHALIAMQLVEIAADFDREIAKIEINMDAMATDATALLRLHDLAFDRDSGRGSGFLHDLSTRLEATIKLVATMETADRSAMETGRDTVVTIHRLGGRIDRLRALRHIVQTAPGKPSDTVNDLPFTMVAEEIRKHSRLLEEAARMGLATLDTLLHLASAFVETGGCKPPQESKAASAATALAVSVRRVREASNTTESDLSEVTAQGDAVVHMLTLSGVRLSLRREIGDILSTAASNAAEAAAGAYRPTEPIPDALIRTLAGFSSHYTMAKERDIHRTFEDSLAIAYVDAEATPPSAKPHMELF